MMDRNDRFWKIKIFFFFWNRVINKFRKFGQIFPIIETFMSLSIFRSSENLLIPRYENSFFKELLNALPVSYEGNVQTYMKFFRLFEK